MEQKKVNKNVLMAFIPSAVGLAILISTIATFLDWRLNPGGVFQDQAGTNWAIVLETYWSWFLPVLLATVPVFIGLALIWQRLLRNNRPPKN